MIKRDYRISELNRNISKNIFQNVLNKSKDKNIHKKSEDKIKKNFNTKNIKVSLKEPKAMLSNNLSNSPDSKMSYKQNNLIEPNTPKQIQFFSKQLNSEDFQQLSQIRFASKQCSSVKQNQIDIDCINALLQNENIDQFSSFLNREEEDLNIEICSRIYKQIKQKQCPNQKIGKIKKNNIYRKQQEKQNQFSQNVIKNKKYYLEKQIQQIFTSLDKLNNHVLTKQNCSSDNLTIELSYIIGSLINKIKVMGKSYNISQFKQQFKGMIQVIEEEELNEIIVSNKDKRINIINERLKTRGLTKLNLEKVNHPYNMNPATNCRLDPISSNFKNDAIQSGKNKYETDRSDNLDVTLRLNKINHKINNYFFKNGHLKMQNQIDIIQLTKDPVIKSNWSEQGWSMHYDSSDLFKKKSSKIQEIDIQFGQKIIKKKTIALNEGPKNQLLYKRENIEIVKGLDGTIFQLNFSVLNKHS